MQRLALVLAVIGCGANSSGSRTPTERAEDSAAAVAALQAGRFDDAAARATVVLGRDPATRARPRSARSRATRSPETAW